MYFLILATVFSCFGCTTPKNTISTEPIGNFSSVSTDMPDHTSNQGTLSEIPSDELSSHIPSNGNTNSSSAVSLKGVWIEYTDPLFSNTNQAKFTQMATERFENIKNAGFNAVFLHVRSNADAIYPSLYFPFAKSLTGTQGKDPGFDPLKTAVNIAHDIGIEIHAWVNPYRVSAFSEDINSLCDEHIAKKWKNDTQSGTDSYVIPWDGKLYFNPACSEVQKLILDGVEEILQNYNVDGIHFDDYFYPVSDANFDIGSYAAYCRKAAYPLSQGDWRRTNVDSLVSATYRLANSYGKEFGISPAAPISQNNTDRNYTQYFINVKKWMGNEGYIDYIAPQLYFGYEHKMVSTRFDALLKAWTETYRIESVKLYIGLAAYKIGLNNDADLAEWATYDDILAREYIDCVSLDTDGIIIYNYSAFFSDKELNKKQRENLILKMNGE